MLALMFARLINNLRAKNLTLLGKPAQSHRQEPVKPSISRAHV
jgi:hypothetical protein